MPIYEFQCTKCKDIFEEFVEVGKRVSKCPKCGAKAKKIISSVGIVFKGSGFYCTDNRSSNGNGSKKSTISSNGTKSEKASKKSDEPKSDD